MQAHAPYFLILSPKGPSEAAPPQPAALAPGLTGAALAVLLQLVVVPALAAVLRQRHLHAVVLAAAVVQGTRVQGCEEKGQNARHEKRQRPGGVFARRASLRAQRHG